MRKGTSAPLNISLDTAIREMYGSLSESTEFEQTLHTLGAVFRSSLTALNTEDFGCARSRVTAVGDITVSEYLRLVSDYSERWQGKNIWIERALTDLKCRGYQHGDAVLSSSELKETDYYRHFLRPLDIRYGMGIHLWSETSCDAVVASFHRGHSEVSFDEEDMRKARLIRPHLANAYQIYRRFAGLERRVTSLRMGFEHASVGIVVLDAGGHILEINRKAEETLIAGGFAKCSSDRRLSFADSRTGKSFDAALELLHASDAYPQAIGLRAPGDQRIALALHLCRVAESCLSGAARSTHVLAFIAEMCPEQHTRWAEDTVRTVLALTAAEARIAVALVNDPDVGQVSLSLGLSVDTVRSHVRSIHAKLGVTRTAGALVLIQRLVGFAPFADPGG